MAGIIYPLGHFNSYIILLFSFMKISTDRIVLQRQGGKGAMAKKIIEYFPKFDKLISLFFGTGAIEFQFLGKINT